MSSNIQSQFNPQLGIAKYISENKLTFNKINLSIAVPIVLAGIAFTIFKLIEKFRPRELSVTILQKEYNKFRTFAMDPNELNLAVDELQPYNDDAKDDDEVNISDLEELSSYAKYKVATSIMHPLKKVHPNELSFIDSTNPMHKIASRLGYRISSLDGYILRNEDIINYIKKDAKKEFNKEVDVFRFYSPKIKSFMKAKSGSLKIKSYGEVSFETFIAVEKNKFPIDAYDKFTNYDD